MSAYDVGLNRVGEIVEEYVDTTLPPHKACNYIVRILHLAAKAQCEGALGRYILDHIERNELPSDIQCSKRFDIYAATVPDITERQHQLEDYDQLIAHSINQKPEDPLYV